jgi:large subunit ribosomal protein L15
MKLHNRIKTTTIKKKRLGHGYGSGVGGHTSSRGQKGQKSRNHVRLSFTGSSWVWFKRLPFMRGKSRFNALKKTAVINLDMLNKFKAGDIVNNESLYKLGILGKQDVVTTRVRLVGTGTISKKLVIMIPASKSAQAAISKAGGEYRVQAK